MHDAGKNEAASTGSGEATDMKPAPEELERLLQSEREVLKTIFPLPPARSPRKATGAAAMMVMLVAGLLWLDPAYRTEHHASAVGERKEIMLADGSRVLMNTATDLEVRWHLRSRRVAMHEGQALFEVAGQHFRPFIVTAKRTRVTVLGTVFEVLQRDLDVTVTVLEGKVRVESMDDAGRLKTAPFVLEQGDQLLSGRDRVQLRQSTDLDAALAWRRGQLNLDAMPLTDVLLEVQRYSTTPIRFESAQLQGLRISGIYDIRRLDEMLMLLPRLLPVEVERHADGSIMVSRR